MSDPGIALIITLLNEEKGLPLLLESIDHQSLKPDEIVVCETGSEDGTLRILREWQESHPRSMTIIEKKGLNIAEGRNQAIIACGSPIVCVTDGGCILEKDWLQKITLPLRTNGEGVGIVYGDTVAVGKNRIGRQFAVLYSIKTMGMGSSGYAHSSRSVAFLRSAWEAVGGYPEWMTLAGEDTYFFRQVEKAFESRHAPGAKAYWHHGEESLIAVFKRHRRNSEGDGEANLWPSRYLALISAYLAAVTSLLLSFFHLGLLPPSLLLVIGLCFRHTPSALKKKIDLIDAFAVMPAITLFRDLGMATGYLLGMKNRASKRLTESLVET